MRYFSIKEKLILNYVIIGVIIIIVVGVFSYYTAKQGIYNRTFDQLTSVRVLKKNQLENFFNDRLRDITFIAESENIIEIASQLSKRQFIFTHDSSHSCKELLSPDLKPSLKLYINHPNNYNGLFIWAKGNVLLEYTDSLQNCRLSSFQSSPLFKIIQEVFNGHKTLITDIKKNKDEFDLFMATPIYNREDFIIGVVILKISTEAINVIMLDKNQTSGLGESGESYLVGQDYYMRSKSRFQQNSVLQTKVETPGVLQALKGKDSVLIFEDYRKVKVLSSFSPVEVPDNNWAILAEIDLNEAMVPLSRIRNNIFLLSTIICLLLFIFAYLASQKITSPIFKLKEASNKIGEGNFNPEIDIKSNDEIGDLAQSFRDMSMELDKMTTQLKRERMMRLRSVIDGQELERQRLSRELHDGLGQELIALRLKLESAQGNDICETNKKIKEIKEYVDGTIEDIKRISNNLMPAVLNEFGLSRALMNLADDVETQTGIKIIYNSKNIKAKLSSKFKTYIYRIAQEAINNAVKHADATNILLNLTESSEYLTLRIEDNGKGFDMQNVESGNGIHNMKERAALMNALINIKSKKNTGTQIIVNIPV